MGNEIVTNRILHGDCLVMSNDIKSGSVDLILTDLPYGNMNTGGGRNLGINGWDFTIEPSKVYEIANRILRNNGKMVLFSQEPYTTMLISEAIPNVSFSYRMIWEKDNFANPLGVKKAPVSYFEDVVVFSKSNPKSNEQQSNPHPCKVYTNKVRRYINKPNKVIYSDFEQAGYRKYAVLDTFNSDKSHRYNFPTENTYKALIELYGIDSMEGFVEYSILLEAHEKWKEETHAKLNECYPSVFNLWQGGKYKSNILKYKKDYNGFHPTQKPVLLLEDLIKTFSNEGDLVVDLTCGSGSTAVAAVNTNRNFICIEQNWDYCEVANERVKRAKEAKTI